VQEGHGARNTGIRDKTKMMSPRSLKGWTFGKKRWKGPECNNGIRNRGLRQQLRGSKQIKNQGTRRQLRLKNKTTSEEFNRKVFGLECVKRATGMSIRLWKMRNWTLWMGWPPSRVENQELGILEGLAPSKTEEKPTSSISVRRAGYVGAPATPGVMARRGKEKNEENLWMMVIHLDLQAR
jgi:hypothetical protein